MKLMTSSSSSPSQSSSPSTLSLNSSLCNSKSSTVGFLSTIFRNFLCSGGLSTHPSDQIRELNSKSKMSDKVQELKNNQDTESTTATSTITPGLVQRLMGLEPMGERTIKATPSSSLSRSKSMNSVDKLGEHKPMEGLHKRAKSSSSLFSEAPRFHLLENENFLVLNFESGCDGGEFKSKGRRKDKGLKYRGECKKNKRQKVRYERGNLFVMSCDNVGNDHGEHKVQFSNTSTLFMACSEKEYVDSENARYVKCEEVTNDGKVKRRKKGTVCYAEKKKVDTECSSEDSSPVSIFDFERQALGTEMEFFGVDTNWRRRLSPELENDQLYVLHCNDKLMIEERDVKGIEDNKHEGSKKKEKQSQEYAGIWVEICRLVDEEFGSIKLEEGLKKKCDFESVGADFESEIFDHLLNELIDQLVVYPLKALQLQSL